MHKQRQHEFQRDDVLQRQISRWVRRWILHNLGHFSTDSMSIFIRFYAASSRKS